MNLQPIFRSVDTYTQEQFARWLETSPPDDIHHYELLDGYIIREPPAGWPHSEIATHILARLLPYVSRKRLGRVFESSQGFDLSTRHTVEPDISFVSTDRWRTLQQPVSGFLKIAPDLVIEVLSPSTRRHDCRKKKRIYESHGVEEYVLVDPQSGSLEVFELDARGKGYGAARVLARGATYRSRVVHGFVMAVGDMFPES